MLLGLFPVLFDASVERSGQCPPQFRRRMARLPCLRVLVMKGGKNHLRPVREGHVCETAVEHTKGAKCDLLIRCSATEVLNVVTRLARRKGPDGELSDLLFAGGCAIAVKPHHLINSV